MGPKSDGPGQHFLAVYTSTTCVPRMNFIRLLVAFFVVPGRIDGETAWTHCLDALEKGERTEIRVPVRVRAVGT